MQCVVRLRDSCSSLTPATFTRGRRRPRTTEDCQPNRTLGHSAMSARRIRPRGRS
jgi:hypothetical protein